MSLLALALATAAPVPLHFGWVPNDRWTVAYVETTSRTGTGPAVKTRTTAGWTNTVAGNPGALSLLASGAHVEATTGLSAGEGPAAYLRALVASPANLRISAAGAAELVDLPAHRVFADHAVAALSEDERRIAAGGVSDVRLRALVADGWQALVGAWAGQSLTLGQPDVFSATAPVPSLGNSPVQTDGTRLYEGPSACSKAGPNTCVLLTLHTTLNPSSAAVAAADWSQRPGALSIRTVTMDTTAHLVTEPATLRPWSLTVERTTHTVGTATTTPVDVTLIESRSWTFAPAK